MAQEFSARVSPTVSTSKGKPLPTPWRDCPRCGWRHYPDTTLRRGEPQLPESCSCCGEPLVAPQS